MEVDNEEDGDGTFYSLAAEDTNASIYLDSTVNVEPLTDSILHSSEEQNSQCDNEGGSLSGMDPDHIDISFIVLHRYN